ncbi:hypothetical protein BD310DRAFT_917391 [Dichomitus squalens]|uniref:Uncharacterized protein n=1 Tax=Dichomitus squalens TaxID=114155 RepID=A0A4Q9Q639_9APHY|nr:hypothetical protein BD310DRAFT_917391 [Dichomitus squalens]
MAMRTRATNLRIPATGTISSLVGPDSLVIFQSRSRCRVCLEATAIASRPKNTRRSVVSCLLELALYRVSCYRYHASFILVGPVDIGSSSAVGFILTRQH